MAKQHDELPVVIKLPQAVSAGLRSFRQALSTRFHILGNEIRGARQVFIDT